MLKVPSDWIVRDGEEKVMSMSCDQQYKDAKVCHHKQMFTKYIFIFWICIAKIFGLAIKVVFWFPWVDINFIWSLTTWLCGLTLWTVRPNTPRCVLSKYSFPYPCKGCFGKIIFVHWVSLASQKQLNVHISRKRGKGGSRSLKDTIF